MTSVIFAASFWGWVAADKFIKLFEGKIEVAKFGAWRWKRVITKEQLPQVMHQGKRDSRILTYLLIIDVIIILVRYF